MQQWCVMADGDLFAPILPSSELHRSFRILATSRHHEPARDMLREVWQALPHPDRNFIREFQTAHFDARIWELYVFAVGHFGPFTVTQPHESPDLLFERDGFPGVWVEAVTANPSETRTVVEPHRTIEEGYEHLRELLPIRLGSPLYSKLTRKYWELPHVAGKPLVFAIGDYSEESPMRWPDASLYRYLYGTESRVVSLPGEVVQVEHIEVDRHVDGVKEIPSGFFGLPDAENISAVIFSNEGTVPKFNRMGFDPNRYPFLRMIRVGSCVDYDPRATIPQAFAYLVGDAPEGWGHGAYVYHNPNAKCPVPLGFFRGLGGQHWFNDGQLRNELRDFAPLTSTTCVYVAASGERYLTLSDDQLRENAREIRDRFQAKMRSEVGFLAWRDRFVR